MMRMQRWTQGDHASLSLFWGLCSWLGFLSLLVAEGCGSSATSKAPQSALEAKQQEKNGGAQSAGQNASADQSTGTGSQQGGSASAQSFVNNALLLVRRGQYEQAIHEAKTALQKNERYAPAMVIIARAQFHLGKFEFADSICDIALSIDAKSGQCYLLKGFIARKQENAPLAIEFFKKATEASPDLGAAWMNLGAEYIKAKNYSAAVPVLEKATQIFSNRPEAYLNLGSAYRGSGELVKAKQTLLQALKLKPKYPQAYFNLGILFLDAPSFPGVTKVDQLNAAIDYLTTYKQQMGFMSKDDPVDEYIQTAHKEIKREERRIANEAKRKARDAAKGAPKKPAASSKPGT